MTVRSQRPGVVRQQLTVGCRVSVFQPPGRPAEVNLFVEPEYDGPYPSQLAQIVRTYYDALASLGLGRETAVFRRFFISDAANQLDAIMQSPIGLRVPAAEAAAVSCIEQPPMSFRKLAMWAYHIGDVEGSSKTFGPIPGGGPHARALLLERSGRTHLWTSQMTSAPLAGEALASGEQTRRLFTSYTDLLRSHDANLLDHCLRTWVFVHDVDNHYQEMVDYRRELFLLEGLTPKTHYIVSTGIEGRTEASTSLVALDAFALLGIEPGQFVHVDSLDHLNRTDEYGVTFERAARLDHADRSHVYISGTASIDAQGNVMFEGDILRQVDRTIENIAVLLSDSRMRLEDVASMIVYLRDVSDAGRVVSFLDRHYPTLPFVTVRAPVCRPGWLVEIEGIAVAAHDDPRWPAF